MRYFNITFAGIIVCGLCCVFCNNSYAGNFQVARAGNSLEINNGKNSFIAEIGPDYEKNLRVYGISAIPSIEKSQLAYASYILIAGPFSGNTQECEMNDVKRSTTINIVMDNEDAAIKIKQLAAMKGRRRAVFIGKELNVLKFYFNGEDLSSRLIPYGGVDPRKALLVTDIVDVAQ